MGDGVVIATNTNGVETNYTYGLERIFSLSGKTRTEYIYDGRGSVDAEVSYNNAWYTLGGTLSKKDVVSKSYTPFGEQIGEQVSGFGYNGEYYNAATGQIYLRARFYEPAMNRFSQKDIIRGSITDPGSLNRYSYVQNDPVNLIDPSGQSLKSAWNMVKSSVTNTVKNIVSNPVQAVKSAAKAVVNAVTHPVKTVTNAAKSVGNAVRTIYNEVRTPDSQSKYASPATNRGTGSAYSGSSSASSGGGAYTASPTAYTSNGSATSYFNSNYQTGKTPSPGAPRIEDVTGEAIKYCASGPKRASNNTVVPVQVIVYDKTNSDGKYEGFREQAINSPYFDSSDKNNVKITYVETAQDFIDAWNSVGHAQQLYIYAHSGSGRRSGDGALIFEDQAISFSDDYNIDGTILDDKGNPVPYRNYSYDNLSEINVKHIYLFSCHGAAYGVDNNIAVELAERSGAVVTANTGSVSFSNIFGDYIARSGGGISDLGVWKMISVDENGDASWTLQWPLNFIGGEVK